MTPDTFTAKCKFSDRTVEIIERVSLLGLEGFAVHKNPIGRPTAIVVSYIATGRRMPGRPGFTPPVAVRRCLVALQSKKIFREDLEEKIAEIAGK